MVLENASTDEFGDSSAPPSDDDAYDSAASASNIVEMTVMRAPWHSNQYVSQQVLRRVAAVGYILGRSPTQDEINYTAYWCSKMLAIQAFAKPFAITAGLWRAYDTRAKYRFPLYTPNLETLKPQEVYPHPRFPLVRGVGAQVAWHVLRASCYISVNYVVAGFFLGSYALSTCSIGAAADPRGEAIREAAQKRNATLIPIAFANGRPDNQNKQRQVPSRNERRQTGMQDETNADARDNIYDSNNDMLSQNEVSGAWLESDTTSSSPSTNESSNPTQPRGYKTAQPNQTRSTPTPKSSGSAWDRLRQQSISSPETSSPSSSNSSSSWATPESSSERGSYDTYAPKSQDDTQAAREKAQKEFDEQIERERQGGSFNSGSSDGFKRW